MPRYRFVAADSTGAVCDGAIDAATQADARNKLAANGLAVREIEEIAGAAAIAPPDLPRRAPVKSASSSGIEPLPTRRPARAEPADQPRRGSRAALIPSLIALAISLGAGAYVVYRDPPWGRLSRYDFDTPEGAYRSQLRMQANADLHAILEYQRKLERKQIREKLDTLQIDRARDFRGKRVLFVAFEQKGVRVHEIAFLERDADAGNMWRPTFVSQEEIRQSDPGLASEMANWRTMGSGRGVGTVPDDE